LAPVREPGWFRRDEPAGSLAGSGDEPAGWLAGWVFEFNNSAGMPRSSRKEMSGPPPTAPTGAATRRRSRARRWAFRAAAIGVSVVCVAAAELVLPWVGVGEDLRLVTRVVGEPRELTFQFNERADLPYFGARDLAGPEPRRFDLPKPAGTLRIVVLGESTVLGFPYPPALAFPRQLEEMLQEQSQDRRIEVLNAGVTALNSFVVADLARQALEVDPDLLVVHMGHN
jgi:hypothetical protein